MYVKLFVVVVIVVVFVVFGFVVVKLFIVCMELSLDGFDVV